jgi:uncharacterized protein (TIGR03437 family)
VQQSSKTLGVFFNGVPAPILYYSPQQINVQVPYEIAGASTVEMQVFGEQIANPVSETRTLRVVRRQPLFFSRRPHWRAPFRVFRSAAAPPYSAKLRWR